MELVPFIPPRWAGAILGGLCLVQFMVSLLIEHKYEKKMIRYLFWVIWYPFVYWLINALTQVIALPRVLFRSRSDRLATWKSPDRGLG
jgi:biofilm PGA synthesis N-glycosyltransferase PgaC